jgi:dTDP-glucose 4,6-dehydratase
VYGNPLVNPQPETYWGNVNPIGPRGVYDEAKRFAEALALAYHRQHAIDVRIARIFNTYGPRMRRNDGRAVPAFIDAALRDQPLPVFGDGSQTRSLCYVDDLIEGIIRLLSSDYVGPVNLGNPQEVTMLELAGVIQDAVGNHPGVAFHPLPEDDPLVRCPDGRLAERELDWKAQIALRDGIERTVEWFRQDVG